MRWLLVVRAACSAEAPPPAIAASAEPAWRAALLAERGKHDHEYKTDVTSPLASVERFTPEATTYVTLDADAVRLASTKSDTAIVTLEKTDVSRSSGTARHRLQSRLQSAVRVLASVRLPAAAAADRVADRDRGGRARPASALTVT